MIQKKHFAGGLLGLVISITLQTTSAATEAPAASWLMSEAELTAHRATMAALEGQAREDYRNAQYEQLKKRALERGFSLPADPPWAKAAASTGPANPATAAHVTETDAAARHAEMRDKLQARREALQKDSEANLERLQQAANAQQQQVEAQLQHIGKEATGRESAAEPPSAATPLTAPATPMPEPTPGPETLAATPPVETPAPLASPAPPTPPTPPTPPASANVADMGQAPRFAPIEQAAPVMPSPDIPLPDIPLPDIPLPDIPLPDIALPETPSPVMPPPEQDTASGEWQTELGSVTPPYGDADAMTAYRNSMRTRFDEYMKERQAQMEEKARRQREKLEAAMEQNRSMRAGRPPHPHYPYPAAPPSYGPRYPAAYPGYRTPYWQQ